MRRWILMSVLFFLVAGCAVGPDYVKPVIETPSAFKYDEAGARDAVNTIWWRQFQDPVLNALISEALSNNKNIKIAAANMEQAAAVIMQTRSPLFPQFGYSGSAGRKRLSGLDGTLLEKFVENPNNSYQTFVSASWEIDLWGRIRRLTESAEADWRASEAQWRGAILSLVAAVANNYIQLLGLDEQLAVSKRNRDAYAESVKIFELRFQYGVVSQMNVEQTRSQYETAAAAIPQIESQMAQTEHALSVLLGRNPGPVKRGKTIYELQLPPVPSGLPSDILISRPDIQQAEQNLISANAQIGAARALYFPTISLTGAYGNSSAELLDLFKGPANAWSYVGSLTGPIFAGGAITAQVRRAQAAQKAALNNYESVIQNSFADVEDALVARKKLVEQIEAQERLVKANSEYTRLARLQYEGGYTPYSTVLQAEQMLFPSEINLVQARTSAFIALVNLYKAMGGGWLAEAQQLTVKTFSAPPADEITPSKANAQ